MSLALASSLASSTLPLPGSVSFPPKVFVPPEAHYSSAGPVTTLFYLQCANNTDCQQITLFCPIKCQHFVEILRKTLFAIRKFIAIYRTVIITFLVKRYCSKSVFISSNWLATRPHYSLNFGSEKTGPHTIKLVYRPTCTTNYKTSQR